MPNSKQHSLNLLRVASHAAALILPESALSATRQWEFWIDRGGTFTDIVAKQPDGGIVTTKVLSENPEVYKDAAIFGIRSILGVPPDSPIPSENIAAVKMGTTVATNALLERKGDRTCLVVNQGLRDVLRIAYQARPDIFARHIVLPELLYESVVECSGRVDVHGNQIAAFDEAQLTTELKKVFASGVRSVAVVLMHAYRFSAMEQRVKEVANGIGFTQVSISSEVSPLMKLVSRGDTATVDAYLSPILRRYVDQVASELGDHTKLMFMQSSGGLKDAALFQGKDSILSGPAGGIVGAARTSELNGFDKIVGFDMGGTSTDVCHYKGEYERAFETEVAGVRMRAPMMHIHTVAAGGGSILSFDGSRLKVGPESAGADPGPACYRRGGPPIDDGGSGSEGGGGSSSSGRVGLAVSDINVMLGKLRPEFFPPVFGPGMDQPLDVEIVAQRFEAAAAKINAAFPLLKPKSAHEVAAGFLAIAVDHMAIAIKEITTRRGIDVSKYTLCSFGGAGGQHACLVADALGMPTCFLHPFAGVLSAYGMGLADVRTFEEAVMEVKLPPRKEKEEEEAGAAAAVGGDSSSSSDGVGGGGESDVRVVAGFGYGAADEEDQGVADSAAVAAATEADDAFAATFHMLATKAVEGVRAQLTKDKDGSGGGGGDDCIEVSYRAQVRYQGTDSTILCDWPAVSIRQEEKESGGGGGMAAAAPVAQRSGEACESVALDFEARHRQQFGFVMGRDKPLVVQSVSVEAWAPTADPATIDKELSPPPEGHQGPSPVSLVECFMDGELRTNVGVYRREALKRGDTFHGPAIVTEATGTTVVECGWGCECNARGCLVLRRFEPKVREAAMGTSKATRRTGTETSGAAVAGAEVSTEMSTSCGDVVNEEAEEAESGVDPIQLEIFNNLFMAIAEQMGVTLQNVSYSVNIKERLDFSCALFDPQGNLIANAPHVPVHLGSMSEAVKSVIRKVEAEQGGCMFPGDVFMMNAPYAGGTHIPDVTVITPVFDAEAHAAAAAADSAADFGPRPTSAKRSLAPLFFVASRGHHSEIGGITPGSMPPFSRSIEEEGIMCDGFLLMDRGRLCEAETRHLFTNHKYPSRNVDQNLSDLRAQIAANEQGIKELHKMVHDFRLSKVLAYMGHVQNNAEEAVRRVIDDLPSEGGSFEYFMDGDEDGDPSVKITVSVDKARRCATVDFTGTAPQQPTNFNAPTAIAQAAVLYVFRTLVSTPIPLNAGCLKPLTLVLPLGSMVNPQFPAAVVAGNVEVSQTITDCLYGALGRLAGSQGTMNNFTFGNDSGVNYYETICGGTGAGPGFPGCDAVHSHMTNTRLTDPEILEFRFPLIVERFGIRSGSGGLGKYKGGEGIERRIKFLESMTVSMLANRRKVAPFGLCGGLPGGVGANWVERQQRAAPAAGDDDGDSLNEPEIVPLGHRGSLLLGAGDVFVIQTPGGGGYGTPEE